MIVTLYKSMLCHVHFVFLGQDSTRKEENSDGLLATITLHWKVQIVQNFFSIIRKPNLFSTVAMKGSKYTAGRI